MENSEADCASLLELLPIEVITVIASYLKARDVVQCCATSSTMREIFSDNFIWIPHCDKELAENLKTTPGKVAPIFDMAQVENSLLSPLPEWRISFMRENHLWNNWRKGKFVKEYIKDINSSAIFHKFYNSDCVIAQYCDRIELLDVKEFPASDIVESLNFGTKAPFDFQIEIADDMIISIVDSGVQVYGLDFNMRKCELKHQFFFENSLVLTTSKSHTIYNLQTRRLIRRRLIVGHLLVGVLEGETTMHIWNLQSGQKLKEEVCPLKNLDVLDMKASDTMHVVITLGKSKHATKTFLAYSLEKFKFLAFKEILHMNNEYCVHKEFVVTRFNNIVHVFNYQTSTLLAVMPTDTFPQAIKNHLLFVKDGDIKVFNLIKKTTQSFFLDSVSKFEVLGEKFLQITKNGWEIGNIWMIDDKFQHVTATNMRLHFKACGFFLNKTCTRYIVREDIGYILNFW